VRDARPDEVTDGLEPEKNIRVVIADDSYLVREALQHVLATADGISVVAMCPDRPQLQSTIEAEEPDVVVTDIRMPPSDTDEGLQIASSLRTTHPDVGVVLLSQFADPEYTLALLEGGSERRAYLLKQHVHHSGQLVSAVRTVADGGSMIDAKVVDALIAERRRAERSPLADLTPRELETISLVARGQSNQAIADTLVLTKRAVEKHINAIFLKLNLTEAMEASVSRRVTASLMYLAENRE
jgi:DNA-binding NarL/FixJ family response regulator